MRSKNIGYLPPSSSHIVHTVRHLSLKSSTDFTAYPEGCPNHPSFPTMHAASSASSLWMAVVMDLSHEQHCEIKALDYAIAYARTSSGGHYPCNNLAGLNIGQEILAHLLPTYLHEKYGSDTDTVKQKIASVRFDWTEYLTGDFFSTTV